jgi:hypothetical protein
LAVTANVAVAVFPFASVAEHVTFVRSDGSYTLIDAVDHTSFHDVGQGTGVFTETHTDGADFYSAAGVFEFRRTSMRSSTSQPVMAS